MQGISLDLTASVWRKVFVPSTGQYSDTQVLGALRCAVVPISSFDTNLPFARESTHILWADYWVVLNKEDQVRQGRRLPDPQADALQSWNYVINGRRQFNLGVPQISYYARELD